MNEPMLADPTPNPLERLLDSHFDGPTLARLLGSDAAALSEQLWERALRGPVRDFVARPSKALRAGLLSCCYRLAGGTGPCPEQVSAVIEILHAGSLIVDDIEDSSSSRRGGPALHLVHGVPSALNAANWMYFWALSLLDQLPVDAATQLALHHWSLRTLLRCHHGQALDLSANVYELPQAELGRVVRTTAELKTGALLEFASVLGALAAGARPALVDELASFGREMGVALQMLDDLGGLLSERRCHKGHEDLLLGRATWPWAWLSAELSAERHERLRAMGVQVAARHLHPELLARELRSELRGSGRVRVRRHLHAAFARLEQATGPAPALKELRAELQRLEKSYV
jgi:geranylgeranyl pyrophosphate synthase